MLVRLIDYVANPGGGVRFAVELLRGLLAVADARFEIVSHGAALQRYQCLLGGDARVGFREIAPRSRWRSRTWLQGIPGAGPLNRLLGTRFHYLVDAPALSGCDLAWLPWIHRHRIPWDLAARTTGSLHDVIAFDVEGVLPRRLAEDEKETVRQWLASDARLVVSSNATVARLSAIFGTPRERTAVVPLSADHERPVQAEVPAAWSFLGRPYLFAPINVTPHKNHEVLLAGFAAWGAKHPLVLSGGGSDLWKARIPRSALLARLAEGSGLKRGMDVFGLGYVDDARYYRLLDSAWALVMPTLAEGGGSFPVWEAMLDGVPVVCSDIPVMREMVGRVGGEVLWFDARQPGDLAARLAELERDYPRIKAKAIAQVAALEKRTWADVATAYAEVMALPRRRTA